MPEDVFRWVVAIAVVLACIAFLVQSVTIFLIYRAAKRAQQAGKEAQDKVMPLVNRAEAILTTTGKMLEENRPRVAEITAEAVVIVKTARQQTERLSALLEETSERVRTRIAQIDEKMDHTVEEVEHAGEAVKAAVMKPVKEVNGFIAGLKAAVSCYAQGGTHSVEHVTQDEEMFI